MKLTWMTCRSGTWTKLNDVELNLTHFDNLEGVYVIWNGPEDGAYVRIGQGKIRDKLRRHQKDPEVQAFNKQALFVTWTSVPERFRDGVEAFLIQELKPKLGSMPRNIDLIPVNLP
jgi:hypothetical protein